MSCQYKCTTLQRVPSENQPLLLKLSQSFNGLSRPSLCSQDDELGLVTPQQASRDTSGLPATPSGLARFNQAWLQGYQTAASGLKSAPADRDKSTYQRLEQHKQVINVNRPAGSDPTQPLNIQIYMTANAAMPNDGDGNTGYAGHNQWVNPRYMCCRVHAQSVTRVVAFIEIGFSILLTIVVICLGLLITPSPASGLIIGGVANTVCMATAASCILIGIRRCSAGWLLPYLVVKAFQIVAFGLAIIFSLLGLLGFTALFSLMAATSDNGNLAPPSEYSGGLIGGPPRIAYPNGPLQRRLQQPYYTLSPVQNHRVQQDITPYEMSPSIFKQRSTGAVTPSYSDINLLNGNSTEFKPHYFGYKTVAGTTSTSPKPSIVPATYVAPRKVYFSRNKKSKSITEPTNLFTDNTSESTEWITIDEQPVKSDSNPSLKEGQKALDRITIVFALILLGQMTVFGFLISFFIAAFKTYRYLKECTLNASLNDANGGSNQFANANYFGSQSGRVTYSAMTKTTLAEQVGPTVHAEANGSQPGAPTIIIHGPSVAQQTNVDKSPKPSPKTKIHRRDEAQALDSKNRMSCPN